MLRKKQITSNFHITYPLLLVVLLTIGLFITINQSQKNQSLNSHAASLSNCTVGSSQLVIKTQEQTLFGMVNQYRVQHNVDHLIWNNTLKQSASWLSNDMRAHNTLSHVDSLGRTPDIRLKNCGYDINNGYGESIAKGSSTAIFVFDNWKSDPAHNTIMLDPKYNIAGVDMEINSSGVAFWTMDFGASSTNGVPTPTTLINYPTPTPLKIGAATPKPTSPPISNPPLSPNTPASPGISGSPSVPIDSSSPIVSPVTSELSPTIGPIAPDMLIAVSVKINGIGLDGNPHPLHLTRKVTAYVYGTAETPVTSGTAYLSYDGSSYFTGTIHLGKLSQGPYFIKLVSDTTLQVLAKPEFQMLLINHVNKIPSVTLYQGDMNGDNVLDINDYNLVLPCFQNKQCDSAFTIDYNDDGKTNVADYNLLLQSFEILHGD
ncbi:MAG TPA: CAP domain-containing protein [Candidatus Acidoferrales bacterium]|nr:CAP domain-containing protein [Candidatus Acidoferrales bacterium]